MRNQKITTFSILALTAIILISAVSPAEAVRRRVKISDRGFYLGINLPFNSIKGDFDDEYQLQYLGGSRAISIPDFDAAMGFGLAGGYKFGQGALEISYLHSEHDAVVFGDPQDATLNMFNFDLKYHFIPQETAQPYAVIGLCVPWLNVEEGALDTDLSAVSNSKYYGYGLNIGGGVTMHLSEQIALTGGGVYRWISYNDVRGVYGDELNDIEGIDGSGFTFQVGIVFKFPSRF